MVMGLAAIFWLCFVAVLIAVRGDHAKIAMIINPHTSSAANARMTFVGIFFIGLLISHWLACFMAASGPGFLDNYSSMDPDAGISERYVAALYWAMTP